MKIRISGGDTDAPPVVRYSFWTWIFAGAVGLIDAVLLWSVKNALVDQAIRQNTNSTVSADQIRSGADNLVWFVTITAVVFAVAYAFFAYRARDGIRSARTTLLVVGVFHLLLSMLVTVSYLVLFSVLLSIVGMVLLYLPTARAYFNPER
ncbi:hypothetical protein [Actinocrispum wychmicini]|uniref:Uncharacterized protein n=1 Tax=Actinocrispum wychmicini TaxID=1213861 RepID=A0A4R2K0S1_9PSEU|nr:hypothetical protein [Actinocrispum wychmicini]TCO65232.1 hypothetical protein EV192_1011020 [Actinocrispum wychmicini]